MIKPKFNLKIAIRLITVFAFLFAVAGCALIGLDNDNDSDDECKKNKRDIIERSFKPSIMVTYSDNKPFSGKATFSIHKIYCDGRWAGKYVENGELNINGAWNVGYIYTYKFEHPNDEVIVKINITGVDGGGLELTDTKSYTYDYEDVENQSALNMKDDYVIQLSWTSTQ